MEKHHVDVVFNGHDHGVDGYPIKNGAIMSRPSQGTVYFIVGRAGAKTYTDTAKKSMDGFLLQPARSAQLPRGRCVGREAHGQDEEDGWHPRGLVLYRQELGCGFRRRAVRGSALSGKPGTSAPLFRNFLFTFFPRRLR